MYTPNDPRFRRTLNQISQNFESANESAQVGLFSFKEHYLKPCLESLDPCLNGFKSCTASVAETIEPCIEPCLPLNYREDDRDWRRYRNSRGGRYGRMESSFDFYDDWDADIVDAEETEALLAAGNADYDRTSGAYGTNSASGPLQDGHDGQARPGRILSYGARNETKPVFGQKRTKKRRSGGATLPVGRRSSLDAGQDPTVIPNQSFLGFDFLSRLPFKITGGGGLRYKPSPSGLQERPISKNKSPRPDKNVLDVGSPEEDETHEAPRRADRWRRAARKRSSTIDSVQTSDESLSSRGDIFPSDEELEDAVALPDEFDIPLDKTQSHPSSKDKTSLSSGADESADSALETPHRSILNSAATATVSRDEAGGRRGSSSNRRSLGGRALTGRSLSSKNINLVAVGSPESIRSATVVVSRTRDPPSQPRRSSGDFLLMNAKSKNSQQSESERPYGNENEAEAEAHIEADVDAEADTSKDDIREFHDQDAAVAVAVAVPSSPPSTQVNPSPPDPAPTPATSKKSQQPIPQSPPES